MQRPINRVTPALPAQAYKTYSVVSPIPTHFRPATCEEIDCEHYRNGWRVRVEGLTPELLYQAKNSGRKFVETQIAEGETWLVFEAGQPCFRASQHKKRLERPELYIVRDGDWRGNPRRTQPRTHQRPADWVEDFATHQQKIADIQERG